RGTVSAALDADGRAFTFSAPGVMDFRGSFSATIVSGGETQELVSAAGTLAVPAEQAEEATPSGRAEVTAVTLRFGKEQIDLLFRLGRIPGVPGVLAQAGVRNIGAASVNLQQLTPIALEGTLAGSPSEWLVTGLHPETPVLCAVDEINDSLHLHEYGGLYRKDRVGFLFGPAGDPVAYIHVCLTPSGNGRAGLALSADMSGVRVDPGQTRWGQQVALIFEPPRLALERWSEWVASTHGARTSKRALTGWSSVYSPGRIASGADVRSVVDQVVNSAGRLRPDVIQIGENFDVEPGVPFDMNALFPEGLSFYAQTISAAGMKPGLKFDFILPGMTMDSCVAEVQRAVQQGFSYLKIGYHQNSETFVKGLVGGTRTSLETYRENFQILRKAAGEDTYILFCDFYPNRATLGLVDASRTGPVTVRKGIKDIIMHVLRSYPLNGRWFTVDNDTYYMATELKDVSPVVGGWPLARTWISMVGLSCGAAFTSDLWDQEKFKPYWRNVEVLTPPATERTEVLDVCMAREWPRLVGHVTRPWGDWTVVLLWNPADKEQPVTLDFAQAGLDPKRRYAVWSFWDNRYLGVAEGSWTTPKLAPSACQHLRFTALERRSARPVLIGSDLHIYCGAAEIKRFAGWRGALEIELTDAGAREGDLYVYSRYQPVLRSASGCTVTGIGGGGENVWRISLEGRQRGKPQQVGLELLLPVTRQIWFWFLIATVIGSLLFAAWRYVSGSRAQLALARLEQQTARQQERARIARDLHDDLGAGLVEISFGSDLAQDAVLGEKEVREGMREIGARARELTSALDEIVWAVNPKHDSVSSLAEYFCLYAQKFFRGTSVRCELEVAREIPEASLNADQRHSLFLAFKEALSNVVQHARATRVCLAIFAESHMLHVSVSDDGCGMDLTAQRQHTGADGLGNMRRRLQQLGGRCELMSQPAQGMKVVFLVSLYGHGEKRGESNDESRLGRR
ncbi:MAG: ATP-binding protein, partial [bacterium]